MKFRNTMLVLTAVLISAASLSSTQINHTWVSGNGSDTNPCTFALPCQSFQGALTNTSPYGTITAQDAYDFGPVGISQSVTIDGNNLGSMTITGAGHIGVYISGSNNVTVKNLKIYSLNTGQVGIMATAGNITIQNCVIANIGSGGSGIYLSGAGNMSVEDSRIETYTGQSVWGIHIDGNGAQNLVVRSTVINLPTLAELNSGIVVENGTGPVNTALQNVTIMGAGENAVWISSGDTQITGSVITQNGNGVYAQDGAAISVASSMITANTTGVCSNALSKIRLDNNDIYDNTTAIGNCGGLVKTSGTNKTSGTISILASDVSDSVTF